MSFTTSWINFASLTGFERFYYFYFLGVYQTPHLLNVQLAYNYVPSVLHNVIVAPKNFSSSIASSYGDQPSPFGSSSNVEQWKVNPKLKKCESFQIIVNELYDPSYGVAAGAGLTLSGISLYLGVKKSSRPLPANQNAGIRY